MDSMRIKSEAMKKLVSKLVTNAVVSKLGVDTEIDIEHLDIYNEEGKPGRFHVSLDLCVDTDLKAIMRMLM